MNEHIIIKSRFCGFPGSGHGGYVAGLVAGRMNNEAEITFKKPPPIDQPLSLARLDADRILLKDGDDVIVEAHQTQVAFSVPDPPTYAEAIEASQESLALANGPPLSNCFVCGCDRPEGDGLRIFPGPASENMIVAAPWIPDPSLADDTGRVRKEFLWAALDCPGAYAVAHEVVQVILLGQVSAKVITTVSPGEKCLVIGWHIATEGRKIYAGTALFKESGELLGWARQTWIEPKSFTS